MNSKFRPAFDLSKEKDVYILKAYTDEFYKVILIRSKLNDREYIERIKKNTNDKKLLNNLSRASTKILELGLCNTWDFFFTGTINPQKYDRQNFDAFYKDFSKWLHEYNYLKGYNIKYVIIPELHTDKENWHMHGLIKGLPVEALTINKFGYLDWLEYSEKFGYCSFAPVYDNKGVALYVTKYISKNLTDMSLLIGRYLYYCSKGLKRADTIFQGSIISDETLSFDFENDFVKIKTLDTKEKLETFLQNAKMYSK